MDQGFATEYLDEKLELSPDHDTDEHDHDHPEGDHDSHGRPDTHPHHTPNEDHGYEGNRGSNDQSSQEDGDHEHDDEETSTPE